MADDFKKVTPGEQWRPPPAPTYNAFVDAAVFAKNQRHNLGGDMGAPTITGVRVTVKNDTGADLDQFAPVILDDLLITPDGNEAEFKGRGPVFQAAAITAQTTGKPYAIMSRPVKSAKFAPAMISGVSPAKINIVSENHEYAELDEADGLKTSDSGPVRILWKTSGTGAAKWALIQFPAGGSGTMTAPVKITARTNYNTYTANVYADGTDQAATETGATVRVLDIATTETIPTGTWLMASPLPWPDLDDATKRKTYYTVDPARSY